MTDLALRPVAPEAGVPEDIRLVRLDLDFGLDLADPLFGVLSAEERATASRFRQPADRLRSAATRAGLRILLGAELSVAPESLGFVRGERGRPALVASEDPVVDFNVSHSGDHALIGWSRRRRVGVDVEIRRPDWDWSPMGRLVLGAEDARHLEAVTDAARRGSLFYAVWTAKEALLKAEGSGITGGLETFSVLSDGSHRPRVSGEGSVAARLSSYAAAWLPGLPGHAACLAWGSAAPE